MRHSDLGDYEKVAGHLDRERLESPSVICKVLKPIEDKIRDYDVLMHRAYEQTAYIDEEIRLREERRFLAETQFRAAKAKHDEYRIKHQAVSKALRGDHVFDSLSSIHRIDFDEENDGYADQNLMQEVLPQSPEKTRIVTHRNLTTHQIFYIFVMHGIGAMIISGGINFGLAYAMYTTQDIVKSPIRLFQLPNTLSGDAAVTMIIQCIITWFVEKVVVGGDVSRRKVQPIDFIDEPLRPYLRWLFLLPSIQSNGLIRHDFKGEPEVNEPPTGILGKLTAIIQEALRGFLLAVVSFPILWPASVGILTTVGQRDGGDYRYAARWTPQIFKGLLGGVLALLTTPLMAAFWLLKAGWEGHSYRNLAP